MSALEKQRLVNNSKLRSMIRDHARKKQERYADMTRKWSVRGSGRGTQQRSHKGAQEPNYRVLERTGKRRSQICPVQILSGCISVQNLCNPPVTNKDIYCAANHRCMPFLLLLRKHTQKFYGRREQLHGGTKHGAGLLAHSSLTCESEENTPTRIFWATA